MKKTISVKTLIPRRKTLKIGAAALSLPLALYLALRFTPYSEFTAFLASPFSTRVYDRNGVLLQIVPVKDGVRREYVPLDELPAGASAVFIAAEDERFYRHFGVDMISVARAAWQNVSSGRQVSGASTITMQLARIIAAEAGVRRGGFGGKIAEALDALRLETRLKKAEILELYLNSMPFGFQTEGLGSAARNFFSTEAAMLSPAQIFCLAVIPRRPGAYSPIRNPAECESAARDLQRRFAKSASNRKKYPALDSITDADWDFTLEQARRFEYPFEAPHLVRYVMANLPRTAAGRGGGKAPDWGVMEDRASGLELGGRDGEAAVSRRPYGNSAPPLNKRPLPYRTHGKNPLAGGNSAPPLPKIIDLTVDARLQRYIEVLIASNVERYRQSRLTQGAAVVIDNWTGETLAWVGSAGFDAGNGGQIDGVLARNQPGSSMKPFLYALALERGIEPAAVLADVPQSFGSGEVYIPRNFNNRFNGPALLRQALASSLNIPAVELLYRLGMRDYSDFLLSLGFYSLEGEEDAGLGLALGNAPVRLAELARAFSVFPNDGELTELGFILGSEPFRSEPAPRERVISRDTARIICSFLSDSEARYLAFGRARNFSADFPLIVKTGTANQYQSIVALAASRRFTAAVWMGNFSGETVIGRTGSSIPAAIARDSLVFLHENLGAGAAGAFEEPESYTKIPVCAASGLAPTASCSAVVYEYAKNGESPPPCTWHEIENGIPVTNYPAEYQGWLLDSRRTGGVEHGTSELSIVTPRDGFVFFAGTGGHNEGIPVEVIGGGLDELRVLYDGAERTVRRPFRFFLPVERGLHTLAVRCGEESGEVRFTVE